MLERGVSHLGSAAIKSLAKAFMRRITCTLFAPYKRISSNARMVKSSQLGTGTTSRSVPLVSRTAYFSLLCPSLNKRSLNLIERPDRYRQTSWGNEPMHQRAPRFNHGESSWQCFFTLLPPFFHRVAQSVFRRISTGHVFF